MKVRLGIVLYCIVSASFGTNVGGAMKSAFNSLSTYKNYTNAGIYKISLGVIWLAVIYR